MSELVDRYRNTAKHGTPQEKADTIKAVDEQIELTLGAIEDVPLTRVGREEESRN